MNLEFHRSIIVYAGNQRLVETYGGVVKQLHLSRRDGLAKGGGLNFSNDDHKEMVAAFEAGDAERAGALMEAHALRGKERALTVLARSEIDEPAA